MKYKRLLVLFLTLLVFTTAARPAATTSAQSACPPYWGQAQLSETERYGLYITGTTDSEERSVVKVNFLTGAVKVLEYAGTEVGELYLAPTYNSFAVIETKLAADGHYVGIIYNFNVGAGVSGVHMNAPFQFVKWRDHVLEVSSDGSWEQVGGQPYLKPTTHFKFGNSDNPYWDGSLNRKQRRAERRIKKFCGFE